MTETRGTSDALQFRKPARAKRRRHRIARRSSLALADFAAANRRESLVDDRTDPFEDDLHDETCSEPAPV
jgi:hypothetical protein